MIGSLIIDYYLRKKFPERKVTDIIARYKSKKEGKAFDETKRELKEKSVMYKLLSSQEDVVELIRDPLHPNDYKNRANKKVAVSIKDLDSCVVFCELSSIIEHSGIYIGDNQIVELNGDGDIRIVSIEEFLTLSSYRTGRKLYTFVEQDKYSVVSNSIFRKRSLEWVGVQKDYNILFDNCHQFTTGCIINEFRNISKTMWLLQVNLSKYIGKRVERREVVLERIGEKLVTR